MLTGFMFKRIFMNPSISKIDVLCVGNASYDLIFSVSQHPRPDEKMIAEDFIECGGGPAANAAVTIGRLGYKSAFLGSLGNDIFGEKHLKELVQEGVNTEFVVHGSASTPLSAIFVKPNGDRSVVNYNKGTKPITLKDVPTDVLDLLHPKVLLFDGHEPIISLELAKAAMQKGIKTVLDAGSVFPGTTALLDRVDYIVCSEKFALDFTGEVNRNKALEQLGTFHTNIVITLGREGLIWQTTQGRGAKPAFPVNVVDTTGAGDVFHGAFAVCIAEGKEWEFSMRYSNAAAALCCTKTGARFGIPTKQEVLSFLDTVK